MDEKYIDENYKMYFKYKLDKIEKILNKILKILETDIISP
tara:strand:+ start:223 stop:342 length:120 start_codon:yes stop_codon:yes gene_type:complete